MVSQCFAVSLSWELTFWHGPMKRITVHRQPKGSFGFSGSLGISLWPKMYTNLTGSSVADECWRIIRCVIEFTCVFTCFKRLLSRNTKASGHHVFFCCSAPYRRAPLKVLRANVCDNSWVAHSRKIAWWQRMVAPIFSGGFIFGPFWLTITEPQSDSTMTFKVWTLTWQCYLSLGCWAPERFQLGKTAWLVSKNLAKKVWVIRHHHRPNPRCPTNKESIPLSTTPHGRGCPEGFPMCMGNAVALEMPNTASESLWCF